MSAYEDVGGATADVQLRSKDINQALHFKVDKESNVRFRIPFILLTLEFLNVSTVECRFTAPSL